MLERVTGFQIGTMHSRSSRVRQLGNQVNSLSNVNTGLYSELAHEQLMNFLSYLMLTLCE